MSPLGVILRARVLFGGERAVFIGELFGRKEQPRDWSVLRKQHAHVRTNLRTNARKVNISCRCSSSLPSAVGVSDGFPMASVMASTAVTDGLSVSAADGRHLARSVVARVLSLANPADLASWRGIGQKRPGFLEVESAGIGREVDSCYSFAERFCFRTVWDLFSREASFQLQHILFAPFCKKGPFLTALACCVADFL